MNQDHLPSPLNKEIFFKYKDSIYENSEVNVFINKKNDFAFLWPIIQFDYNSYKPRVEKIGLENHLQWLSNSKPGGNSELLKITSNIENNYKVNLEKINMTDSIIWVGKPC